MSLNLNMKIYFFHNIEFSRSVRLAHVLRVFPEGYLNKAYGTSLDNFCSESGDYGTIGNFNLESRGVV